jgi:outer membrane receptor protein involved in Fe transport
MRQNQRIVEATRRAARQPYVNLSLRAGLRVDERIAVTLVADNLLDVDYKTYASGAYAPGRNLILGVRGSL